MGGRRCLPGGGCPVEDEGPLMSMVGVRDELLLFFLGMVSMGLTVGGVAGSWETAGVESGVPIAGGLELFAGFVVLQ